LFKNNFDAPFPPEAVYQTLLLSGISWVILGSKTAVGEFLIHPPQALPSASWFDMALLLYPFPPGSIFDDISLGTLGNKPGL